MCRAWEMGSLALAYLFRLIHQPGERVLEPCLIVENQARSQPQRQEVRHLVKSRRVRTEIIKDQYSSFSYFWRFRISPASAI